MYPFSSSLFLPSPLLSLKISVATSHSKVSPQKVTVSPGLSSLNSPSSSSRGGHEEIQKKYEEICNSKLQLENEKLDKELEIRNLKYKLDQKKGEFQAILDDKMKLEVSSSNVALLILNQYCVSIKSILNQFCHSMNQC